MLALISAVLHIYFDHKNNYLITYIFKPLTLIAIISIAITQPPQTSSIYKILIIVGLSFSLIGDSFLMLKKTDYFLHGLLAFLLAHLIYIGAIVSESDFKINLLTLLPIVIYFGILSKLVLLKVKERKSFVTIYATIILILLWFAISRTINLQNESSVILLAGIFLFTISDFILAYNKFVKNFNFAQIIILSTYYSAQLFIALSI